MFFVAQHLWPGYVGLTIKLLTVSIHLYFYGHAATNEDPRRRQSDLQPALPRLHHALTGQDQRQRDVQGAAGHIDPEVACCRCYDARSRESAPCRCPPTKSSARSGLVASGSDNSSWLHRYSLASWCWWRSWRGVERGIRANHRQRLRV